ncbi:MAG: hypothetical protein ACI9GH_000326 [Candidatus Paceibacteria bacterium]|jgi:hypothetical protein
MLKSALSNYLKRIKRLLIGLLVGIKWLFIGLLVLNFSSPSFRDSVTGIWDRNRPSSVESLFSGFTTETSQSSGSRHCIVKKDDTLSGIGRKFGTSVRNLTVINGLSNDKIFKGQKLKY